MDTAATGSGDDVTASVQQQAETQPETETLIRIETQTLDNGPATTEASNVPVENSHPDRIPSIDHAAALDSSVAAAPDSALSTTAAAQVADANQGDSGDAVDAVDPVSCPSPNNDTALRDSNAIDCAVAITALARDVDTSQVDPENVPEADSHHSSQAKPGAPLPPWAGSTDTDTAHAETIPKATGINAQVTDRSGNPQPIHNSPFDKDVAAAPANQIHAQPHAAATSTRSIPEMSSVGGEANAPGLRGIAPAAQTIGASHMNDTPSQSSSNVDAADSAHPARAVSAGLLNNPWVKVLETAMDALLADPNAKALKKSLLETQRALENVKTPPKPKLKRTQSASSTSSPRKRQAKNPAQPAAKHPAQPTTPLPPRAAAPVTDVLADALPELPAAPESRLDCAYFDGQVVWPALYLGMTDSLHKVRHCSGVELVQDRRHIFALDDAVDLERLAVIRFGGYHLPSGRTPAPMYLTHTQFKTKLKQCTDHLVNIFYHRFAPAHARTVEFLKFGGPARIASRNLDLREEHMNALMDVGVLRANDFHSFQDFLEAWYTEQRYAYKRKVRLPERIETSGMDHATTDMITAGLGMLASGPNEEMAFARLVLFPELLIAIEAHRFKTQTEPQTATQQENIVITPEEHAAACERLRRWSPDSDIIGVRRRMVRARSELQLGLPFGSFTM